jgi:hypothetical protein
LAGPTKKNGETPLEAVLEALEAGPGPNMSGPPDKSGTTTRLVRWRLVLALWKPVDLLDKSGET